jgi:hypothetical protein
VLVWITQALAQSLSACPSQPYLFQDQLFLSIAQDLSISSFPASGYCINIQNSGNVILEGILSFLYFLAKPLYLLKFNAFFIFYFILFYLAIRKWAHYQHEHSGSSS